jgi:hypothetical protein
MQTTTTTTTPSTTPQLLKLFKYGCFPQDGAREAGGLVSGLGPLDGHAVPRPWQRGGWGGGGGTGFTLTAALGWAQSTWTRLRTLLPHTKCSSDEVIIVKAIEW